LEWKPVLLPDFKSRHVLPIARQKLQQRLAQGEKFTSFFSSGW
jgi:hypothetical protein